MNVVDSVCTAPAIRPLETRDPVSVRDYSPSIGDVLQTFCPQIGRTTTSVPCSDPRPWYHGPTQEEPQFWRRSGVFSGQIKHTACIDASSTQIPPSSTQPRACGQKYTRIPLPRVARCAGCGFHRNTMQLHGSICGHGPKTSRKPVRVNKYVKGAWAWWTCPEAYQRKEPCLEHRRTADSRKDLLR